MSGIDKWQAQMDWYLNGVQSKSELIDKSKKICDNPLIKTQHEEFHMYSTDLESHKSFIDVIYDHMVASMANAKYQVKYNFCLVREEYKQNHFKTAESIETEKTTMNSKIKFTYKDKTTWVRLYREDVDCYDNEVTYPGGEVVRLRVYTPEATPEAFKKFIEENIDPKIIESGTRSWIEGLEFVVNASQDATEDIAKLARKLPGVGEMVKHPVTGQEDELYGVIMSLNDSHDWTREQIADFVDNLPIDTSFDTSVEDKKKARESNPIVLISELGA